MELKSPTPDIFLPIFLLFPVGFCFTNFEGIFLSCVDIHISYLCCGSSHFLIALLLATLPQVIHEKGINNVICEVKLVKIISITKKLPFTPKFVFVLPQPSHLHHPKHTKKEGGVSQIFH